MNETNDKHGFFVSDPDSGYDRLGFAVVARSADEAKEIVHEAGWLEHLPKEDIECLLVSDANIEGLPIGMVKDDRDALCRGLYDYLHEYECDECKMDADVTCYKGRALCEDCFLRMIHGDDDK